MENCNPVKTSLNVNQRLTKDMGPKDQSGADAMRNIPYKEALGSLIYFYQATRPDIDCAISILSSFAENPGKPHWNAVKRVLRYLKGTKDYKLKFSDSGKLELIGYCDADWAGELDTRRSTSGYVFLFGNGAVSWCSKKQLTISLSSTESEYIAIALANQELLCVVKRVIA